jgi:hypothetical protein
LTSWGREKKLFDVFIALKFISFTMKKSQHDLLLAYQVALFVLLLKGLNQFQFYQGVACLQAVYVFEFVNHVWKVFVQFSFHFVTAPFKKRT